MMETSTVRHGQRVALHGGLDARGAASARAVLHAAVLDGTGDLVVDMSDVDLLDAVGLGVLVATRRLAYRHDRTLVLESCTPRVARLLHATRLHRVLTLRDRPGQAGGADQARAVGEAAAGPTRPSGGVVDATSR